MFDFAWTEIALIVVVALIFIGPKDLPVAIKTVSQLIKKARRMAGEFQTHVDEMVREANLDEVRNQINEIRNFDFKGEVERAVDPDGSLRGTMASATSTANPFDPATYSSTPAASETREASGAAVGEHAVAEQGAATIERPDDADAVAAEAPAEIVAAPAFIPPAFIPPALVPLAPATPAAPVADAPAFVPPAYALKRPAP